MTHQNPCPNDCPVVLLMDYQEVKALLALVEARGESDPALAEVFDRIEDQLFDAVRQYEKEQR